MTGRCDYFLSTERSSFFIVGLRETRHGTDHRLILAVLRGQGVLRNFRFRRGRTRWPIRPKLICPQTDGGAAFAVLKGWVPRTPRPKKACVSWISQDTWKLADSREVLQRAQRASAREVRQARRSFQRDLKGYRQRRARKAGEDTKSLMESDKNQEAWKRLAYWYKKASGGKPHRHKNAWTE